MKLRVQLEEIDVRILAALEKHGAKTSTRELSKVLDIPARTIRYRLSRLKEKDFMCGFSVQTHERKLGLGEFVILLRSPPNRDGELKEILDSIRSFYYFAPTYGRYDGYLIHAVYPLATPHMIPDIMEGLKRRSLIHEYYLVDIVDYARRGPQFSKILSEKPWTWKKWAKDISRIMKKSQELKLNLEESPQAVSFDTKDVQILTHKVANPDITLRELGEMFGLSQPQVHNRMKRLEESGIIRGYKIKLKPFENPMRINCYFRSSEHALKILKGFHVLPFYIDMVMESDQHYYVSVDLPSSEVTNFLSGLSNLRPYTEEMFIQIALHGTYKGFSHLISNFDLETANWTLSTDESLEVIERLSKGNS